jgi:hypothetical protein
VKNRFQNLPFKCNLKRYKAAHQGEGGSHGRREDKVVYFIVAPAVVVYFEWKQLQECSRVSKKKKWHGIETRD